MTHNRSITRVGTEMQSYYGRPILKEPVWQPEIPYYFFFGGIAGASTVLHLGARLAGNRTLARRTLFLGAAAAVLVPARDAGPARRLAVGGVAAELGLMEAMQHRLGFVGEVYKQGEAGRYGRISKLCTAVGAALLATAGKRSRAAAVGSGALVLAGELALR